MKTRVLTGAVLTAVLVLLAVFSGTWAWGIAMAILSALGVFEMMRCIGIEKNLFAALPCILLGAALPLLAKAFPESGFSILAVSTGLLMLWMFSVSLFSHGRLPVDTAGCAYLGLTYVLWGFCLLSLLRELPHGEYLFLLPFLGAWISDTFAYFTGRLFGRHKLIPDVSPKKTVEGAVGGILFAMAFFGLYGFAVSKLSPGVQPRYAALVLLGLPVSVVSIIGDLVMSLVKRRYGVKDYGRLFPGHGGVLDRFDSVIATSVVLYLLCAYTEFFGILF